MHIIQFADHTQQSSGEGRSDIRIGRLLLSTAVILLFKYFGRQKFCDYWYGGYVTLVWVRADKRMIYSSSTANKSRQRVNKVDGWSRAYVCPGAQSFGLLAADIRYDRARHITVELYIGQAVV